MIPPLRKRPNNPQLTSTNMPSQMNTISEKLQKLGELLDQHQTFLLMGHRDPDGDSIGSVLALRLLLLHKKKSVTILADTPYPDHFQFLKGAHEVKTSLAENDTFDATILCDFGEVDRAPKNIPPPARRGMLLVIDHHKTSGQEGTFNLNDPNAPAVGILIYKFAMTLNIPIDTEMAKALYTSILSDTGGFRYQKTTPETMNIAAHLLELGVKPWEISSHLYESNPIERQRLLALALQTLELHLDGQLAFITIEEKMYEQTGATYEMTDGFVNFARGIKGVEIAILLREQPDGCKLSIRSKGNFDASQLALQFGGGGHHNAAGASLTHDIKTTKKLIIQTTQKLLTQSPRAN